jgi:hypothetical protein
MHVWTWRASVDAAVKPAGPPPMITASIAGAMMMFKLAYGELQNHRDVEKRDGLVGE